MSSESNKEYSVNWKNHMSHVRKAFDHLLNANELTDVTLCCEGKKIGAHKMLLSACSAYFRDTFKDVPCQHPVIILYGVEYGVLSDILHFIYNGEVSVDTSKLDSFLKTAQLLQISGLTDSANDRVGSDNEQTTETSTLEQDTEGTYTEAAAPISSNDDAKKGVKRVRVKESEATRDKMIRQETDTMFITDVKCEPNELVSFEDPLEDPLLQSEEMQQNDTKEFFRTCKLNAVLLQLSNPCLIAAGSQNLGQEDFKRGVEMKPRLRVNFQAAPKGGRSLCLNGYKYLIDKKDRTNSKVYWRCNIYKKAKCSGRLITDLDYNLIRISAQHVHLPASL